MPIYEFECLSCEKRFDRLQKLSDPDPTSCPNCSTPQIRRCVTAPTFRLAGSGWYETDFKGDKDKKKNLATGTDKVTPVDAKPEAKSETGKTESTTAAAKPTATAASS